MFQCKNWFGSAAFSSLGFLAFSVLSCFSGVASAQSGDPSFETAVLNYLNAIENYTAGTDGGISSLDTRVGLISTYVDNLEAGMLQNNNTLDTIANRLGTDLSTDVHSIMSYSHSIDSRVQSAVSSLTQLANDVAAIKLAMGTPITASDLSTQIQYITSRLDTIQGNLATIIGTARVSPADVLAIRQNVATLLSELQDLRTYDLTPVKRDLSDIDTRITNVESDTGQIEQYWLPEIVDRLDLLLAASNSAAASPVTITNIVNLDANVWEPFMAWTNLFVSFNTANDTSAIFDTFDTPGYHTSPWWGDIQDELVKFPDFMSLTLGGTLDQWFEEEWESSFNPYVNEVDNIPAFSNWYWWMAEGVRRQLQSLGQATNLLSRVADGLDQIHTINYEILQSVKQFSSVSNVVSTSEYVSETNDLVSSYPGFQDDASDYPTDYSTNDLPRGSFYSQIETDVSPEFESKKDDIIASLSPTWDVQGQGLFRVKSDELSSALSSFGITPPAQVGTFEVDLNSQAGHTYDAILDMIADPIKNIYDLFKYLFCILVVYGEIRYYLSGGKTK